VTVLEDRLVDIETKLSYQEHTVQELGTLVYQQQKKIDQLEAICASLVDHVRNLSEAANPAGLATEKPPHY
jgi:SlyX protein